MYSKDLEKALKKYIDSLSKYGKEELRQLLQQASSVDRYSLLMNVRGDKYSGTTGLHKAALYNDLETMKYMLEEFTVDEKYDVLKIQIKNNCVSALHYAAGYCPSSTLTYLLADLSQQQKYNLFQLQKIDRNTPLHVAASKPNPEAIQAILASLSLPLLPERLR